MVLFGPEKFVQEILQKELCSCTIDSMIDVCAGKGSFTEQLLACFTKPPSNITAIEHKPDQDRSGEKAIPSAQWIYEDAMDALEKIQSETVDLISISKALHHLPDPEQILVEMHRIVKPSGWLIVQEPTREAILPAARFRVALHDALAQVESALGITHHLTYASSEVNRFLTDTCDNMKFSFIDTFHAKETDVNMDISHFIKMIEWALGEKDGLLFSDPKRIAAEQLLLATKFLPTAPQPIFLAIGRKLARKNRPNR